MRTKMFASVLAVGLGAASSLWASTGPYGYTYAGNAVTVGSGGCSAVTGTFPTTASLLVDSSNGAVVGYFLNILIQSSSLPPQYITDVLSSNTTGSGALTSYDPQLLGSGTALTGVSGSYTGQITFPNSNFLELGTNFGQANQTPIVLSAPIAGTGQTCTLSLTGVLKVVPG